MTLPASGAISISQINTEVGAAANTARALSWVQGNTYYAHKDLNSLHGAAWFTAVSSLNSISRSVSNTTSNCASNCAAQTNPSNFDGAGGWANCTYAGGTNQCGYSHGTYLQANCNCNCNCVYNCRYTNCNCNCACSDCNCCC